MEFEGISRIQSSERVSAVFRNSGSGRQRQWALPSLPEPGRSPEMEGSMAEDVEFSALDPVIGAILTLLAPAACGRVASKIKELLAE